MTADEHLRGQPHPTAEQVAWVFHHLNSHYDGGGSFRELIYGRMGFDAKAYGALVGQGMGLSNLLNCARDTPEISDKLMDCYM